MTVQAPSFVWRLDSTTTRNGTTKKAIRNAIGTPSRTSAQPRGIRISSFSRGHYRQIEQRRVLLAAVDVAVAEIALPDRTTERDLDGTAHGHHEERRDLVERHAVEAGDRLLGDRPAVAHRLETCVVLEQNVEGEAIGSRVLAADDVREVAQALLSGGHFGWSRNEWGKARAASSAA